MYAKNELMFPFYAIPYLGEHEGEQWGALVRRVSTLPETHEEVLAFMLMMIRLNGCLACETDSYRAMRGCAVCAQQTLRRFKDPEHELLRLYDEALGDVQEYMRQNSPSVLVSFAMEPA